MGNNLFNANISGKLATALGGLLLPIVLIKKTAGARDAQNPSHGAKPVEVRTPGRGFVEKATFLLGGKRIKAGNMKATILGDTLKGGTVVPEVNDEILFKGKRYLVDDTASDPDAATYELSVRGL